MSNLTRLETLLYNEEDEPFYFQTLVNGKWVPCTCEICSEKRTFNLYIWPYIKAGLRLTTGEILYRHTVIKLLDIVERDLCSKDPRLFDQLKDTPSYFLKHLGCKIKPLYDTNAHYQIHTCKIKKSESYLGKRKNNESSLSNSEMATPQSAECAD